MLQALIAITFYTFSALSVFRGPLFEKLGSIQWDAVNVHFFNLFFSSEAWSKEMLPLWSPYIFAGFPQIADLQVAFFYPINFLISAITVFTPELLMKQMILHYFLAGFFAFLLARNLSKNFWFSIAAGLVYSFGGFMVGHASHTGMQNTATWLPLIFLFLILALKKTRTLYAGLGGLALGIAILAGHFQISLYIAYALAFYFAFDFLWMLASSITKKKDEKSLPLMLHKLWLIFILFMVAFSVSAVQLLPTYELTRESNRAKISLEMSQTESLNPKSLQNLIEPNYNNVAYGIPYSGPWDRTQNYLYIGKIIIILAILGAISGIFYRDSRKMTLFWLALLIISLFYSFGEFSFLQKYFYRFMPFFDKIRAPSNMMLLFDLSILGLASSLFNTIHGIFKEKKDLPILDISRSLRNTSSLIKKTFFKNAPAFLGLTALVAISLEILPAILGPNTLLYSRQKTEEITAAPPVAAKIREEYSHLAEIDKFRIFKIPGLDRNLTQMLHIFAFDGYNPLSLRRHSVYVDAMVKNEKLIDLAGIKYLPCEFVANREKTLEKIDSLCINKNYFPLAFLADNYLIADNETDALRKTQEADLKKTLILEETPIKTLTGQSFKGNIKEKIRDLAIVGNDPGLLHLKAKTDSDTFLFLAQANYPGWTARIDGYPVKVYQADYLFQALFIPKGEHEIIMKYGSRPLISGAILTIIGLSAIFIIILYDLYLKQRAPKKEWEQTVKKFTDKQK